MASKADEDSEKASKSVGKFLPKNVDTSKKYVAEEEKDEKDKGKRPELPENKQLIDEEMKKLNALRDESESGTFQGTEEELYEKVDSFRTTLNDTEKNEEVKVDKGKGEDKEKLTPEEKEEQKTQAQEYKERGNDYFKTSEYPEAMEFYANAIKICPDDFAKEKSVYHANRAACLVKLDQHKEAIEDCTKALDLNPDYMKVRLRRAQCYEHEDRLEEALEDYQKVFDADRSSHVAREALMRLPEEIRVKHEKMKEEMIGKLKELGNVFLRPFGLSTDNFKLQQDPDTGGYSVNFQK